MLALIVVDGVDTVVVVDDFVVAVIQ
ncbi:hypothetical protein A2U01_0113167, partial [Trifolium medium]|nr:hypothetical protein [Trifolium medium]